MVIKNFRVKQNKHKIVNDPVWGFIDLDSGLLFDLIEHPYFQRLRRIRQLGLTSLVYSGAKKITRLPSRSAIVAFSAAEVYAIAELIRRQRGGAAVVLGALSPRTRNAQVALYQSGDVDYLVATDAIGMLTMSHLPPTVNSTDINSASSIRPNSARSPGAPGEQRATALSAPPGAAIRSSPN